MLAERYGTSRLARLIACIMAIAAATPKAITATQIWARISFLPSCLVVMGHLARRLNCDLGCLPLRLGHDLHLGHHALVSDAAVLVARDQVLTRMIELGGELADVARYHHRLAVGANYFEAVSDVDRSDMERDR